MENLTNEQIERINEVFADITCGEDFAEESESLEDKIEGIWQYYDCAGFDIKTEKDLFRLLNI